MKPTIFTYLAVIAFLAAVVAFVSGCRCITRADLDPLERRVLELERRQRMADQCEPESEQPQQSVKEQRA